MKRVAALLTAVVLCQLLASCDSGWPYKPVEFKAPVPPPPKHGFTSGDSLKAFCGTGNVTLFYSYSIQGVMVRTIFFVHFTDSNPVPVKLKKPAGRKDWYADSPMPSPDGKLVTYYLYSLNDCAAYIQKVDSTSDPVLIAEPGSDPHFYKDSQGKLFVTYADITGLLQGSLSSFSKQSTFKQQVDSASGVLIGSRDTLVHMPFYGGISKDGRYICTGYAGAYIYDFSDSTLHPINSGLQTCNPSMSTDPVLTDRMMFLNFGGTQNLNNFDTSEVIDTHKDVFIVDKSNTVVKFFDVNTVLDPSKIEWQCPEWSNNPDYFAALAKDAAGNYDVYLVQISSGKALRINNPANFHVNSTSTPYVFLAGGAS